MLLRSLLRPLLILPGLLLLASCRTSPTEHGNVPLQVNASGIDQRNLDPQVRAQDDFFRYVNGHWLATTEIPADRARWGAVSELADETESQLRDIVGALATAAESPVLPASATTSAAAATNEVDDITRVYTQQVADFYKSYMDEARIEGQGLRPLLAELATIEALGSAVDIVRYMGRIQPLPLPSPLAAFVGQDGKQADHYIVQFTQSGLGLPDRDYYLGNDERLTKLRAQYKEYIRTVLDLRGNPRAAADALAVLDLETAIAKIQWPLTRVRDRDQSYHKLTFQELHTLAPSLDWNAYFDAAGLPTQQPFILRQPEYTAALATLINRTPAVTWRAYFTFHLLSRSAPYLNKAFVEAHFAFYGKALGGAQQLQPRWRRGVQNTDRVVGEQLGKLYVAKYFQAAAKARMQSLVANLRVAFAAAMDELPWMSPPTRLEAKTKLAKVATKIGYPDQWRDYSTLLIRSDDLIGNIMRSARFDFHRDLARLNAPVDRTEWGMTPQTVNAYYNPSLNEVVFPAAILQPPFFNLSADDAVNYGAIGAIIGHEMSHGFDDQGRKSDGDGNLRDWWTTVDAAEFKARANKLVSQYNAFTPIPGKFVNGELTLGENIGDLSGIAIAYRAYHNALQGAPAPVIDGFTGDQRFFIGYAQAWRTKQRDEITLQLMLSDTHSPPQYRVFGVLRNIDAFYAAFGVKPGDGMYLPPEQRVKIW